MIDIERRPLGVLGSLGRRRIRLDGAAIGGLRSDDFFGAETILFDRLEDCQHVSESLSRVVPIEVESEEPTVPTVREHACERIDQVGGSSRGRLVEPG